ncbi:hypothetical protein BDW74DRAFT_184102 [Aspergillus multicolor]|uniref:uncharacterized protein n=1 Tax=Aspergillus multicolor TaxID=41759 RepID=UPI003CCD6B76
MGQAPEAAPRAETKATPPNNSPDSNALHPPPETNQAPANTSHFADNHCHGDSQTETSRQSKAPDQPTAFSSTLATHIYAALEVNAKLRRWEDDQKRVVDALQRQNDELREDNEDLQRQLDDAHRLPTLLEANFRSDIRKSNAKLTR